MEKKMQPAIFIFDFDLTLTQQHTHNLLFQAAIRGLLDIQDSEAQWNHIKNVPPTGSVAQWKSVLTELLTDGHYVAIASFNEYPLLVKRYLEEKLGLDKSLVEKIHIESWLPTDLNIADKNQHIQNIIQHFNYQGELKNIILVDDSEANRNAARKLYSVIEVISGDKTGKHLEAVMLMQQKLKGN